MDIYRNGSKISSNAYPTDEKKMDEEVKKSTVHLLQTIVMLSNTLDSLPEKVILYFQILLSQK